jgi:antitoxin (DNA-binding transcriptional repressor) of toxin-antitoxin stability system
MNVPVNAERLQSTLPDGVERVRKGTRFTVIYRSRPAFQIVPVDDHGSASIALADDSLDRAHSVGSSEDGRTSIDHDATDNHFSKVGFDILPAVRCQANRKPRHS